MIELIAYSLMSCEDAEEIIKKFQQKVNDDVIRTEMIQVIKDNSETGCFVDKTSQYHI